MYVVAIFLKRYSLMAMGFAVNPLGQYTAPYVPSLAEVMIALGLLSVGMLIVTISAKILPLAVPDEEHEADAQLVGVPASEDAAPGVPSLEVG
jgi:Ni/Fe-hydrogenase subunit HybB-like protein